MKLSLVLLALVTAGALRAAEVTLLNVSYDPTREFYAEYNETFAKHWKEKSGDTVVVNQSHGGSSEQARAVIDGLEADVVTLALGADVDALYENGRLVPKDWQTRLPHNSAPCQSMLALLVRKGNPKGIKDWDGLVKPGVEVITPNPKTSRAARWNYLAAWGYALRNYGSQEKAREFISERFKHVPVLDSGARGATTTFVERGLGDVLINWENELLPVKKLRGDDFEIVVPSVSILAEPAVSVVDKVVDKRGTREVATEYLAFLSSDEGQELAAKQFSRPSNKDILAKYAAQYPNVELFTIDDVFGGWTKATKEHFVDGASFDQIYRVPRDKGRGIMAYYEDVVSSVGSTPLINLNRITAGLPATIGLKGEFWPGFRPEPPSGWPPSSRSDRSMPASLFAVGCSTCERYLSTALVEEARRVVSS